MDTPWLEPYREAVARVGPRFESLLWRDRRAQVARFRAAAELLDPTGRVVADMGCGLGDYAAFLHGAGWVYGRYIGVDGINALLDEARARADAACVPECLWLHADFVADPSVFDRLVAHHRADVINFGGSLNTMDQADALGVLGRAWEALRRARPDGGALVFNFLSAFHRPAESPEVTAPARRFDTLAVLRWAMERTPLVRFRLDHLAGHDAMIAMGA